MTDTARLLAAIDFAAKKHKDQRRKDIGASPYINHPVYVARVLADIGKVDNTEILMAAILHDTLEDTATTTDDLDQYFGTAVRTMVEEVTDDKQLPKEARKQAQIEHAATLSEGAAMVKMADKIANVQDVMEAPPSGWSQTRRRHYGEWAATVVSRCPDVNPRLKSHFNQLAEQALRQINQD